ncbi:unnamed protein product [Blepharisma stoltei]|uniref:Maturase K n=1 Tax=Blepharisma stoltei TaxID=1481888 RepID=A0AAU9JUB6_9CILI|nr:unnamed protein product [Blepharisma stoltei]
MEIFWIGILVLEMFLLVNNENFQKWEGDRYRMYKWLHFLELFYRLSLHFGSKISQFYFGEMFQIYAEFFINEHEILLSRRKLALKAKIVQDSANFKIRCFG